MAKKDIAVTINFATRTNGSLSSSKDLTINEIKQLTDFFMVLHKIYLDKKKKLE